MKKTGHIWLRLIAATLVVAFCADAAWAWYKTTLPTEALARPVPRCEAISNGGSNVYKGSPWECEARVAEAVRIQQNPGLVTRDGEVLTVNYRGRISARLVPVDSRHLDPSWRTCDTYGFRYALALYDPESSKPEKVPVIQCSQGEFTPRFILLPTGERLFTENAASSPNGRLVAQGQDEIWSELLNNGTERADYSPATSLSIMEWPSRKIVARFDPACRPLQWNDDHELTVKCEDIRNFEADKINTWLPPHDLILFEAKVQRGEDGIWRMRGTRWVDGSGQPVWSMWPLPSYTGRAS